MSRTGSSKLFLVVGLVALLSLWATHRAVADECDSVAQPKLTVGAPAAGAAAAFSGVWSGIWNLVVGIKKSERHPVSFCGRLHVSVTGPQSAAIAYCVGNQPELGMVAGCSMATAAVSGNQLTFVSASSIPYTFTVSGGGLMGQYTRPGGSLGATTEFHKVQ
jgi:hypothetical protein